MEITAEDCRELRVRDVVLIDLPPTLEQGELVLRTGERFFVSLVTEGDRRIATVGERVPRISRVDQLGINLLFRVCDPRELLSPGSTIVLPLTYESLTLSWRDEAVANGAFVEVEGERGVRVSALRNV